VAAWDRSDVAAKYHPAWIGADVASYMSFATRVHWYAIKAYPLTSIHFRHVAKNHTGFIIEAGSQWKS
jgi:hypothetical protein